MTLVTGRGFPVVPSSPGGDASGRKNGLGKRPRPRVSTTGLASKEPAKSALKKGWVSLELFFSLRGLDAFAVARPDLRHVAPWWMGGWVDNRSS